MSTAYKPSCRACRSDDPTEFHKSCDGCRARQAHALAQQRTVLLTDEQVKAMDSTMEPQLETKS